MYGMSSGSTGDKVHDNLPSPPLPPALSPRFLPPRARFTLSASQATEL